VKILGTFLSIVFVLSAPALAQDVARTISVNGVGVVQAEPDMAVINLGVTRNARTAAAAMDATSLATSKVLDAITDAGVAPIDVQTSSVNLSPRWDHTKNGPPVLAGYIASNTLTLRVRDLTNLPQVLDAVVGTGANSMNGLTLTVAEPRPLEDEARQLAVRDARAKAELLAETAGVALGGVVSIAEGGGATPPAPMMRAAVMEQATAVPIASGQVEYRISVGVVFDIDAQ